MKIYGDAPPYYVGNPPGAPARPGGRPGAEEVEALVSQLRDLGAAAKRRRLLPDELAAAYLAERGLASAGERPRLLGVSLRQLGLNPRALRRRA